MFVFNGVACQLQTGRNNTTSYKLAVAAMLPQDCVLWLHNIQSATGTLHKENASNPLVYIVR